MLQIGSFVDGKYEVLKEIGRGGMSIVYLAMDRRLNKQWAIKVINKNETRENGSVQGLLSEARLMKKLDHPALPRIVDIIDTADSILIIMDYIEGESLEQVLKRLGPQPEAKVLGWAGQLCDALIYLHGQTPPVIYRDMKPSNIMLRPDGSLRIIDFGIARECRDREQKDTVILGTVGFAPPEQYLGKTDERSDIYALGMTLLELLGENAAHGGSSPENGISEEMHLILHRCIRQDPSLRYQSAAQLFEDLLHPEYLTKEYRRKQKFRKRLVWVLGVTSLVFWLLAGVFFKTACHMDDQNYALLIKTSAATDVSQKIDDYKKAIAIYPGRAEAYMKMLEAYETAGTFSKKESDEFLACYNAGQSAFNGTDTKVMTLNFKAGLMYFNYYEEETKEPDISLRVQKAYPFFEANEKNAGADTGFAESELSHTYWLICSFYKKYILASASVDEASKGVYEDLLKEAGDEMALLCGEKSVSRYDLAALYHSIFMFIFDQREDMANAGVDKDIPLHLMDQIYSETRELSVRKKRAEELKQEIEDNYSDYRAALLESFSTEKEDK